MAPLGLARSALGTMVIGLSLLATTSCGCGPPVQVKPVSSPWQVGETHPEPCFVQSADTLQPFLDADARLWVLQYLPRFPFGSVARCLQLGALEFPITGYGASVALSTTGTIYWVQGVQYPYAHIPMIEVTALGEPIAGARSVPPFTFYGPAPLEYLAVDCVSGTIVSVAGHYFEPAPGYTYPSGGGPQCDLYSHITKEPNGALLVVSPDGQQIRLKPDPQPVILGGTSRCA